MEIESGVSGHVWTLTTFAGVGSGIFEGYKGEENGERKGGEKFT